jgi:ubiquinone biosynthesis protein
VIRSARALLLFWTVFASYGVQWLLVHLLGRDRLRARGERVHVKNARRLAFGFMRLRGVFIKLGQVLSVLGGFLPVAYGRELERLQDQVPPRPFDEVAPRLTAIFGDDLATVFERFDREALAAASLAQVHRARAGGRELAIKILYPDVEDLIRRDLAVLRSVEPVVRRMLGLVHMRRVLEQLTDMLGREIDYDNERKNLLGMRRLFADREDVVVPDVVASLSGPGVLAMSFEEGRKIVDLEGLVADGIDRVAVAQKLVDCYLTMLVEARVFHADPHPGNFLVRPAASNDGASPGDLTLVILDHGAVESITEDLAEGMKMVVFGALSRNDDQILLGVERMGFVAEGGDREMLARVGRDYLKALAEVRIDDFSQLDQSTVLKLTGYDQTRGRIRELMGHIHYPDGFFYVERTLVLLFGLVGRLAPDQGLPGLVMPMAPRLMAAAMTTPAMP